MRMMSADPEAAASDSRIVVKSHRTRAVICAAWLLATLAASIQPASALSSGQSSPAPTGETQCDLGGWTAPLETRPIEVRAAPGARARVIGTLPTASSSDDDYAVDFSIIGSSDGWLKIADASDAKNEDRARPVYGGVGWIRGSAARLGIQSGRGYAQPDIRSEKLLELDGAWLTERATIEAIVGCSGKWVQVEYRLHVTGRKMERIPKKPLRAWFRGACAIAETTCDMPSVDRDPEPVRGDAQKGS